MTNPLLPANQNNFQRAGFAFSLVGILLLVFAHNPFGGYNYSYEHRVYERQRNGTCSDSEYTQYDKTLRDAADWEKRWPNLSSKERDAERPSIILNVGEPRTRLEAKCFENVAHSESELRPFDQWTSNDPIVNWLGPVLHLLSATILMIAIGLIWIFVFAKKQ